jgi:cytochrome c oxidase assembly factor CtaG
VVTVLGWISALFFAIAFILYATKTGDSAPWTPEGFTILGLLFLVLHLAFWWYPVGRRPGGPPA